MDRSGAKSTSRCNARVLLTAAPAGTPLLLMMTSEKSAHCSTELAHGVEKLGQSDGLLNERYGLVRLHSCFESVMVRARHDHDLHERLSEVGIVLDHEDGLR